MKKIIIAEDFPSQRKIYRKVIEHYKKDFQIDEVENGSELVKKVKENNYDIIFTDQNMPGGINGLSAVKRIREFNKKVQIYLISDDEIYE